jgi:predicted GIY-YIG superfamily endonuclease
MLNICSIYKITNSVNKKIYIGQTWKSIENRFAQHKNPSQGKISNMKGKKLSEEKKASIAAKKRGSKC